MPMVKKDISDFKTRWVRRMRMPVFLLLIGLAFAILPRWLLDQVTIETELDLIQICNILSRIFIISAAGWAIATIGDGLLQRRLRQLKLDVEDNLHARKIATQLDVIRRIWIVVIGTLTIAAALTVIPGIKQVGVSLFASAGIAGIAIGLAARPMLSNLIAGLQIAFTQPIRIDDVVIVEGEWGWIEEISLFYVVIKIWDWRRLVVPLSYFIEKPFQNWTRKNASIIGSVFWSLDYRAPIEKIREKLNDIVKSTDLWDGQVVNLQVTEAQGHTLLVRALATADTSPRAWDLRCYIREQMINWLQNEHPESLPMHRGEMSMTVSQPEDNTAPVGHSLKPGPNASDLGDTNERENIPDDAEG